MLELEFIVEEDRIKFFCGFLGFRYEDDLASESSVFLGKIKKNWDRNRDRFEKKTSCFFEGLSFGPKITVSVFPPKFRLGCCNTHDRLILFGQPPRSTNFSSAIIAHESCHILLKNNSLESKPLVNEVLCLLVEASFYKNGLKDLDIIWPDYQLDDFHLAAKKVILDMDINLSINIKGQLLLLNDTINKETINIHPEKGLLKNIKE